MADWASNSFDVSMAGGFGESSFSGAQGGFDRSRATDKIPMPVTVADLCSIDPNDEKYTLGSYSFSTVRVIGQVKSSTVTDDSQSIEYVITDPKVPGPEFRITHYRGISQSDISADPIVEGTEILAFGKLRSFNQKFVIVAFVVREIEDKREIEILNLEAKLARMYYRQNLPGDLNASRYGQFDETMLRGPKKVDEGGSNTTVNPSAKESWAWKQQSSTPSVNQNFGDQSYESCRGLVGQRAEIFKYLRTHGDEMIGASLDSIRKGIPKNAFNQRTFDSDIEHLASEGLIYSTSDDYHFAANA